MPEQWQDIPDFSPGQLFGEVDIDKIVANLKFLRTPARHYYQRNFGDGNYTTTNTAFENIDATNMLVTLQTYGNPVRMELHMRITHSTTGFAFYEFTVDGTPVSNNAANGLWEGRGDLVRGVDITRLVTGLAPGLHTFSAQWRTSTGTLTGLTESAIQFEVHEEY